jgi:hypothetical protein
MRSEHYEQPTTDADASSPRTRAPRRGSGLGALLGIIWFVFVWVLIGAGKLIKAMFSAALWGFFELGNRERYDR